MATPRNLKILTTLLLCVGALGKEFGSKGMLSNSELQMLQSGILSNDELQKLQSGKFPTPGQMLKGAICFLAHHQSITNRTDHAICGALFKGKLAHLEPLCEAAFMKSWEASTSWCSNLQDKEALSAAFKFPNPGQILDAALCFIAHHEPIVTSTANAICGALFSGKLATLQPQCEAAFEAMAKAATSFCPKLEETELQLNAAFKFPTPGQLLDGAICFIANHETIVNSTANAICGALFKGKLARLEPECAVAFEDILKSGTSFCHKLEEEKLLSTALEFPTPGQIMNEGVCWLAKQKPIESDFANAICQTLFRGRWASIQPQCEAAFGAAWELPMKWCPKSQQIVV